MARDLDRPEAGQAAGLERRPRSTGLLGLLRDETGSALTEGLIMIPFLIIVYGCIWFVHARYIKRIQVGNQARSCAWAYVQSACETAPPPPCAVADGAAMSNDDFTDAMGSEGTSALNELRENLGFLGPMVDQIFGRDITASAEGSVAKPTVLGSGTAAVKSQYVLVCNEKPRDIDDVVKDVFHQLTGW